MGAEAAAMQSATYCPSEGTWSPRTMLTACELYTVAVVKSVKVVNGTAVTRALIIAAAVFCEMAKIKKECVASHCRTV